ncbi:peptidoglycan DD-metalloendopeptidase family protein [Microcella sp.]|uniref:peptidoglycan DD-metalloendopeptidase family protein n=1 Tax=Microcella sp. TaxID=1913979 RepID=UPI003F710A5B
MTTENPWLTGGSEQDPTGAERDPFRSLGLGFTEESPTIESDVEPAPEIDVAPLSESSVMATTSFPPAAQPGSDLVALPPAASTELVATSRRALRDAERAVPAARRPRRADSSPRLFPARGPRRASAPETTDRAVAAAPAPVASASRVPLTRRIAKKAFPPIVMLAAASLLVGTSVPANALFDPDAPPASLALSSMPTAPATEAEVLEEQVLESDAASELASTAASRAEWGVTSYAEMLRLRYGSTNYSYSPSGVGAIRWPFPFAANITSAFGDRVAPCRGCSSYHRGVDFDAGYGAPVGAIADGIVTAVGRSSSFGYRVEVEHIINGQKVLSLYAHMIDNSSVLELGAPVVAGEIVGALGNTGLSTGPHLHLEIHIDGVPIDPFAWLMANAV